MANQDLQQIRAWYETGQSTNIIEKNYCETRFEFNGRLLSYENILRPQFSEDCLYLAISSMGEIGNNCFDHNLGFWQEEQPGCLFVRDQNYCILADRGRGIKTSLSKVYDLKPGDGNYIHVAFEKVVSGRAPEKRGNGLKFAKKYY